MDNCRTFISECMWVFDVVMWYLFDYMYIFVKLI